MNKVKEALSLCAGVHCPAFPFDHSSRVCVLSWYPFYPCVVDPGLDFHQLQRRMRCQQDHRDKPIVWLAAVQALESSRYLVRLGPQARTGARAHQRIGWTGEHKMSKLVQID